jgi:exopolyphosphatase/pppGpp-phosphohydrolase
MSESLETNGDHKRKLKAVIDLTHTCESEFEHVMHVSNLTLRFFDELEELHKLTNEDRFLLQCASLLHDIGWVEGWKNHHKTGLNIILDTTLLPFDHRERLIIGSIARYHRKALPNLTHDHFAALSVENRQKVQVLASFLRLADGLDDTHQRRIRDIHCKVKKNRITVLCDSRHKSVEELKGGAEKADLLSLVFDREVIIKIQSPK